MKLALFFVVGRIGATEKDLRGQNPSGYSLFADFAGRSFVAMHCRWRVMVQSVLNGLENDTENEILNGEDLVALLLFEMCHTDLR